MIYYQAKHFKLEELVDPTALRALGQRAWELLDPRLLATLDQVRERFGPVVVNTWHQGGQFSKRGFRSPEPNNPGARFSQHQFGRAADMHFLETSVPGARAHILAHPHEFPYVTAVEVASWLHLDCRWRNRDRDGILVFHP